MLEREAVDGEGRTMILYRLHGCPYCERVARRLDRLGVDYDSRFVAGEHSRRNEVARKTGTRSVPVLIDRDHGVTMSESGRLLEYLERTYGDGGGDEPGTAADAGFELPTFSSTDHPTEGDRAPDFTRPLVTEDRWEDVSLSAFAADAGGALLVFYPLNWGGKSMYWWKEIRSREWGLDDDLGVVGLGVSQPFDHQRFIEKRDLPYPLYSDPGNGVAERYAIVHDLDGMSGIEEPRPAAFLLDESLTVEYAWVADEWPETPPYDEIESAMARPSESRRA